MQNPLGLKAHHVTARVRDVQKVTAWYCDVLGLECVDRGERLGGQMKFSNVALPGYSISFVQLASPAEDARAGVAIVPSWVHPVFSVPDANALYRRLLERGERVATFGPVPPIVKQFLLYDCEGNEIEIVSEGEVP
jgi:catechol 2,3-dioxygenase-like lactoylglutathione lyase family enzyme